MQASDLKSVIRKSECQIRELKIMDDSGHSYPVTLWHSDVCKLQYCTSLLKTVLISNFLFAFDLYCNCHTVLLSAGGVFQARIAKQELTDCKRRSHEGVRGLAINQRVLAVEYGCGALRRARQPSSPSCQFRLHSGALELQEPRYRRTGGARSLPGRSVSCTRLVPTGRRVPGAAARCRSFRR